MKTITEQNFRILADAAFAEFTRAASIVNMLENIGLFVSMEKDKPGLHELYGIQDTAAKMIVNILGDDRIQEKIDRFMLETSEKYPEETILPEHKYQGLLKLITSHGIILPWDVSNEEIPNSQNKSYRYHRAIAVNTGKPIVGHLWIGSNTAYIIPETCGICYDDNTENLTAHAVQVYKPTIAVEMAFDDDNGHALYEGDTVRIGDDIFVLMANDMEVLRKLVSPERQEKGLYRVKHNYNGFDPKKNPCNL